jgi:hypothetical protein
MKAATMYLARRHIGNQTHYAIHESYKEDGCWKSRHLYDLGSDPTRYIIYPGGHGYYYDPEILEALSAKGLETDQSSLDVIFFDFLTPQVQRVINGFDRSRRGGLRHDPSRDEQSNPPIHIFDKRRFCFLRFGPKSRQLINRVPPKVFRMLLNKSRDELEQNFLYSELSLNYREMPLYVATIFELNHFVPRSANDNTIISQLDNYFLSKLCHLDRDSQFWLGTSYNEGLHEYLVRYAIMYFDYEHPQQPAAHQFFQDFINRHRIYRPPASVRSKIKAAEKIFGLTWEELNRLPRKSLSRRYRRLSLVHHPDHGGDAARFDLLTQIYQHLLKKRPKAS